MYNVVDTIFGKRYQRRSKSVHNRIAARFGYFRFVRLMFKRSVKIESLYSEKRGESWQVEG